MASRPCGVSGVITMKMISKTSSTSMSGVTLIFALWPPLGPTAIPISFSLLSAGGRSWRRSGTARRPSLLFLIGQQAQIVHARGTHVIHDFFHRTVARTGIRFHKYRLAGRTGNAVLNLVGQIIWRDLVIAQIDFPIAHHSHDQ